jgi:general secretion pathway protein N
MTARASALGLAAGLALTASSVGFAAAPAAQDIPPAGVVGAAGITILDTDKPAVTAAKEHQPRGNPLWAVPLSVLSATRERPIFLPSRRPPAPVIANTRSETPKPSAVPPPERPRFALVGAVTGENEAIAVFLDQATNGVIRLRMGQDHDGWVLSSVNGRTATLQKDQKTFVLNLVPRSTPKNGEPDGL